MKNLLKTIVCLIIILACSGAKRVVGHSWLYSKEFLLNLLFSIQLATLLWLLLTFICEIVLGLFANLKHKANAAGTILFILLFGGSELLLSFWLRHPIFIPKRLVHEFKEYFYQYDMNVAQYDPGMAVYDSSLFYKLKPSATLHFQNYEFRNTFITNSKGLRDNDGSLVKPPVIVLGDSYAMGWGVDQPDDFAERLEVATGMQVLNTGIASFGTARELKQLFMLDTSALKYLIIQYGFNDEGENKNCIQNNFKLRISSRQFYDSIVSVNYWNKKYFPGKHTFTLLKRYILYRRDALMNKNRYVIPAARYDEDICARHFMEILYNSPINFNKTKVIVIVLDELGANDAGFIIEINRLAMQPGYIKRFGTNFVGVPVSDQLTQDDYYILDGHLNQDGHRKVARILAQYIKK